MRDAARLAALVLALSTVALAQNAGKQQPYPGGQSGSQAALAPNTSAVPSFPGQDNGNAPAGDVSKIPMSTLLYRGATTRVLVRFMPWFDGQKHSAAGYRSDDPARVHAQVADMMSRGISGAAVAWYGPEDSFKDKVTAMLARETEATGGAFQFVLSYSGELGDCAKKHCDATAQLTQDLNYAADKYFSSPAYITVNNRPLLFIFGLEKFNIDWKRVHSQVHGHPMLMFRNASGFDHPESDGAYSWIDPKQATDSDPAGLAYLRHFYDAASRHPNKLAVGSVYKGFDDSLASWGQARRVAQNCGNTWLATWKLIASTFEPSRQLPFVLIVTWNDYEEGTEIETGIDDCLSVDVQLGPQLVTWQSPGNESAVDHYAVYAGNGQNLSHVSDVPANTHELALGAAPVSGAVVQAVGKPSIINHAGQASSQVALPNPAALVH